MKHQCSNYRGHHSSEFSGNYPCATCTLERRVEELVLEIMKLKGHTEEAHGRLNAESEPYSGFTLEEWKLMFKGGPLLCGVGSGTLWIEFIHVLNAIDGPVFHSGTGIHKTIHRAVELIEQPNWRPHLSDDCPVPGRVRVEVSFDDNSLSKDADVASSFLWISKGHYSDIRAYRILNRSSFDISFNEAGFLGT